MIELKQDITKGILQSAYVEAPFDEAKKTLETNDYRIISLQENAKLRMQEGKDAYVSRNGNWTREGVIYVPKKGAFLVRNSPIMKAPVKSTNCHREGNEFYLTKEQVEKSLADSVLLSVKAIPTDRLGDSDIGVFAFGNDAKAYGEFLKGAGISEMLIYTANLENKPFARQMWFRALDSWSVLGGYWGLVCSSRLRGVRDGKADAQKILVYTPEQIKNALNKANLSGIEKLLFDKLSK